MERWPSQWHEGSLCFAQVTIDKFLLNYTNEVMFSPLAESGSSILASAPVMAYFEGWLLKTYKCALQTKKYLIWQ